MVLRLGILISGKGSNMLNIMNACRKDVLNAEVCIVITNNLNSLGIKKAAKYGIKTEIINPKLFTNNETYEKSVTKKLKENRVDLVCLAGYTKILGNKFVNDWKNQIINIHPSLLPAFKGLNAQEQALKKGVKFTGCTIHYVNKDLDDGEIIDQKVVQIDVNDTLQTLTKKILKQEHKLYIKAILKISKGKI